MSALLRYTALSLLLGLYGCSLLQPAKDNAPEPVPEPEFKERVHLQAALELDVDEAGFRLFEPFMYDGLVHAVGENGKLEARAADGRTLELRLDRQLSAGIDGNATLLVAANAGGEVLAWSRDGSRRWAYAAQAQILQRPRLAGDLVLVRTVDGRLLALAAADGQLRWQVEVKNPALMLQGVSGLAFNEESVFVGYPDGRLRAYQLADGRQIWETWVARSKGSNELDRMADVAGTPWLDSEQVCVASYQGKVGCFGLQRGEARWSRDFSSSTGVDGDHRHVYATDASGTVVAFDKFSGSTVWKQERLFARKVTRPTVFGKYVAVADMDGVVYLLEGENGELAGKYDAGDAVRVPLQQVQESLLVQDEEGNVSLLRLK